MYSSLVKSWMAIILPSTSLIQYRDSFHSGLTRAFYVHIWYKEPNYFENQMIKYNQAAKYICRFYAVFDDFYLIKCLGLP